MELEKRSFTKEDTTVVRGLAIVIMLLHHLLVDPNRLSNTMPVISFLHVFGEPLAIFIGRYGDLCISFFLFLSGLGLMMSTENSTSFDYSKSLFKRLKKLYLSYWKVFIIFVPIGFIFFSNQTAYSATEAYYTKFAHFNWKDVISAFLGLTPEEMCGEWWFFRIYVAMILLFPIVRKVIEKCPFWVSFWMIICTTVIFVSIVPRLPDIKVLSGLSTDYLFNNIFYGRGGYIPSFLMGALMGHNNNLLKLDDGLKSVGLQKWYFDIVVLALCVFVRNMIAGIESDPFLIPMMTLAFRHLASAMRPIHIVFLSLGRHSTTMWLTHTFYIYYFGKLQALLLLPRFAGLVAIVFVAFTWGVAVIIDNGYSKLGKLKK